MLNPVDLHEIALTLENEREFHDEYKARAPDLCHGGRRDLILSIGGKLLSNGGPSLRLTAEDREQLRRYFDDIYDMPATVVHKAGGVYSDMSGLPTIEFWLDSVKYPPKVKAKPEPSDLRPVNGTVFDTSYINDSAGKVQWLRAGLRWTDDEERALVRMFLSGSTLKNVAQDLQRAPSALVERLVDLRYLQREAYEVYKYRYLVRLPPLKHATTELGYTPIPDDYLADIPGTVEVPRERLQQEVADHLTQAANSFQSLANNLKEIIMSKTEIITIETKTLINGVEISTFKDSEIYSLIAAQESEINSLEQIKAKPKKLIAEIEKRKAGIEALVAYLDSKE